MHVSARWVPVRRRAYSSRRLVSGFPIPWGPLVEPLGIKFETVSWGGHSGFGLVNKKSLPQKPVPGCCCRDGAFGFYEGPECVRLGMRVINNLLKLQQREVLLQQMRPEISGL